MREGRISGTRRRMGHARRSVLPVHGERHCLVITSLPQSREGSSGTPAMNSSSSSGLLSRQPDHRWRVNTTTQETS